MKKISEEKAEIKSTLYNNNVLWYMRYSDEEKEVCEEDESDEVQIALIPSFDYEIPAPGQWLAHIDFELDYPELAKIRVRTSYEVSCIFEHFMTHDCLDLLHEKAMEMTIERFNIYGEMFDMDFEPMDVAVFSQYLPEFSEQAIKKCMLNKENDFTFLSNKFNVITIKKSDITQFLITATIVIMDDILYNNKAFNLKHNRKVFHAIIPSTVYFTTRTNCLKISEGDIKLVMSHNIAFQTCMDCALQMLLERHLDTLMSSIAKRGFSDEVQPNFLKYGTEFLIGSQKELQDKGVEIANLQQRYDWNKEIK